MTDATGATPVGEGVHGGLAASPFNEAWRLPSPRDHARRCLEIYEAAHLATLPV